MIPIDNKDVGRLALFRMRTSLKGVKEVLFDGGFLDFREFFMEPEEARRGLITHKIVYGSGGFNYHGVLVRAGNDCDFHISFYIDPLISRVSESREILSLPNMSPDQFSEVSREFDILSKTFCDRSFRWQDTHVKGEMLAILDRYYPKIEGWRVRAPVNGNGLR